MEPSRRTRRILVLGLRTWGQLGNYLAARKIANILADQMSDCEVSTLAAEDLWPYLATFGERMGHASAAGNPVAVACRYQQVIADVEASFPAGFEAEGTQRLPVEADVLDGGHALVLCAKGIVSRLAYAALRRTGREHTVVNFVTNHGLLEMPVHRSPHLALQLLPFQASLQLLTSHGCDAARLKVVGPLPASSGISPAKSAGVMSFTAADNPTRPRVVVFSNRGGDAYLELARLLAFHASEPEVLFVAHSDPQLVDAVSKIAAGAGARRWEVLGQLDQPAFLAALARASAFPSSFAVSKTGPNTALELVRTHVPMLLHRSGLPMERWVEAYVAGTGCGRCTDTIKALVPLVCDWLDRPEQVAEAKRNAVRAATDLDAADTRAQLASAVRMHLDPLDVQA